MKYSELVEALAAESGRSKREVRDVLSALAKVGVDSLREGKEVPLRGLCTIGSRWQAPRAVRDIRSRRRMMLDGRFVVRYRTSKTVKDALSARTPQLWREEGHQAAWRTAETLIGDLEVYHGASVPTEITAASPSEKVRSRCAAAFGPIWAQVEASYQQRVPEEVRSQRDYLALAAIDRWADQPLVEDIDDE